MAFVAFIGNFLTTYDCLGGNPKTTWMHAWLGPEKSVLDLWDNIAEGILMPLTGLIMVILLGWVIPHYLDEEIASKSSDQEQVFKGKGFYNICLRYIAPILLVIVVYGMIAPIIRGILS